MGIFIAVLVFVASSVTAVHVGHLHHNNTELSKEVKVLKTQEDGNGLHMDGVLVRNLSDE